MYNTDGSLNLYIQSESPGKNKGKLHDQAKLTKGDIETVAALLEMFDALEPYETVTIPKSAD